MSEPTPCPRLIYLNDVNNAVYDSLMVTRRCRLTSTGISVETSRKQSLPAEELIVVGFHGLKTGSWISPVTTKPVRPQLAPMRRIRAAGLVRTSCQQNSWRGTQRGKFVRLKIPSRRGNRVLCARKCSRRNLKTMSGYLGTRLKLAES